MIVSKFVHQCRGTARSGRNPAVAMVGPPCAPFFRGTRPGKAGQASAVTPAVRWRSSSTDTGKQSVVIV
jgi:hypothetical protein